MATKEPDRPNPNPELKMPPSQTKIMEQCRKEACDWVLAEVTKNLGYTPDETLAEFVVERNSPALHAYAQALYYERSKWLEPEMPPRPPDGIGEELPRYGLKWNGPDQPLSVPMNDGYWTPFHIAEASINALVQAVHDNRSKRPTVEQLIDEFLYWMSDEFDTQWLGPEVSEGHKLAHERLRSRLTKLLDEK